MQTNVLVRLASTIARQSSSETSSSGLPTCPQTPPAQLTRMSIAADPLDERRHLLRVGDVACIPIDAVSVCSVLRECALDRRSDSAGRAGDERDAALEVRHHASRREHVADFLDARPPDPQDVLVGPHVEPAERAVSEQLAHVGRIGLAHRATRPPSPFALAAGRLRSSRVQGKFSSQDAWLASGSTAWTSAHVRGAFHQLCQRISASGCAAAQSSTAGRPASFPPWPFTSRKRRKPWACRASISSRSTEPYVSARERRAARVRGEVRRDPVRQRWQDGHAERLRRLDRHPLGEDLVDRERQVGVLLDRAERKHDPVVLPRVLLELHPVAVLDPHPASRS